LLKDRELAGGFNFAESDSTGAFPGMRESDPRMTEFDQKIFDQGAKVFVMEQRGAFLSESIFDFSPQLSGKVADGGSGENRSALHSLFDFITPPRNDLFGCTGQRWFYESRQVAVGVDDDREQFSHGSKECGKEVLKESRENWRRTDQTKSSSAVLVTLPLV
jgi:hypothetical protein